MRREPERHVIVGCAGSGKTTTAKAIAAHLIESRRRAGAPARMVVFDPALGRPADEWRPKGATYAWSRLGYLRALEAGASPLVVKPAFSDWHPLERMRDLLVVVDEAHRFASPRAIDPSFARLALEGRHGGVDLVVATQRPRHVHGDVIANATRVWIHPLLHPADREAVERGLGISLRGRAWNPIKTRSGPHPTARHPLVWPDDFSS